MFPGSPYLDDTLPVKAAGYLAKVAVPFVIAMLFAAFVRGQAGVVVGLTIVLFISVLQWFGRHL